tara:strand:+ start:249 stop:728 length:480 start_codon:yes stop_codon:yes gene_type:complete
MLSTLIQTLCAVDTTYPGNWINSVKGKELERHRARYLHARRIAMWMERSPEECCKVVSATEVLKGVLLGWMDRKTIKKADMDTLSFVETNDVSSRSEDLKMRVETLEEENRKLRTALRDKSVEQKYEQHQHLLAEIHLRSKKKGDAVPIGCVRDPWIQN